MGTVVLLIVDRGDRLLQKRDPGAPHGKQHIRLILEALALDPLKALQAGTRDRAKTGLCIRKTDAIEQAKQPRRGFISGHAARRYAGQIEMIEKIEEDLRDRGLMVEKINVKGDTNVDANPLVSQLPKYNDTANKTLGVMLDIIQKLGTAAPVGDKLGEFLNG